MPALRTAFSRPSVAFSRPPVVGATLSRPSPTPAVQPFTRPPVPVPNHFSRPAPPARVQLPYVRPEPERVYSPPPSPTVITTTRYIEEFLVNRKKFTETVRHQYDVREVSVDTQEAYFVGLKEIEVGVTDYAQPADDPEYALTFRDRSSLDLSEELDPWGSTVGATTPIYVDLDSWGVDLAFGFHGQSDIPRLRTDVNALVHGTYIVDVHLAVEDFGGPLGEMFYIGEWIRVTKANGSLTVSILPQGANATTANLTSLNGQYIKLRLTAEASVSETTVDLSMQVGDRYETLASVTAAGDTLEFFNVPQSLVVGGFYNNTATMVVGYADFQLPDRRAVADSNARLFEWTDPYGSVWEPESFNSTTDMLAFLDRSCLFLHSQSVSLGNQAFFSSTELGATIDLKVYPGPAPTGSVIFGNAGETGQGVEIRMTTTYPTLQSGTYEIYDVFIEFVVRTGAGEQSIGAEFLRPASRASEWIDIQAIHRADGLLTLSVDGESYTNATPIGRDWVASNNLVIGASPDGPTDQFRGAISVASLIPSEITSERAGVLREWDGFEPRRPVWLRDYAYLLVDFDSAEMSQSWNGSPGTVVSTGNSDPSALFVDTERGALYSNRANQSVETATFESSSFFDSIQLAAQNSDYYSQLSDSQISLADTNHLSSRNALVTNVTSQVTGEGAGLVLQFTPLVPGLEYGVSTVGGLVSVASEPFEYDQNSPYNEPKPYDGPLAGLTEGVKNTAFVRMRKPEGAGGTFELRLYGGDQILARKIVRDKNINNWVEEEMVYITSAADADLRVSIVQTNPNVTAPFILDALAIFQSPIGFDVSNDGGITYQPVISALNNPRAVVKFAAPGNQLKVKVKAQLPNSFVRALTLVPLYSTSPNIRSNSTSIAGLPYQSDATSDYHVLAKPLFQRWFRPFPQRYSLNQAGVVPLTGSGTRII